METNWLSKSQVKEFSVLSEENKLKSLITLVKACNYQEQVNFVSSLNDYLHKDFISHLPPKLVEKVLAYVSVEDAVNCTMVSKKWNEVVGACLDLWDRKARELGLGEHVVQELMNRKFKSLKDLCICAFSQQSRIHSLMIHKPLVGKNPSTPGASFLYAGFGITLRYTELNGHAQVTIERIISPHTLVEIATIVVKPCSGTIKWASASEDYVMWKQLDGCWNGYDITSLEGEVEHWVDEPVFQGFHSISFCRHCHLVSIVSEAEDDSEVWDLQVIKLNEGKATVRKTVYPLPLERIQKLWKKRHFLGGEVNIISNSLEQDEDGFCKSHRVCLQADSKLVVYQLKSVPQNEQMLLIQQFRPNSQLSKPIYVFAPASSADESFSFMDQQVASGRPRYCYSSNYSYVALYHESILYIWNLTLYKDVSQIDMRYLQLPSDCKCVAVGGIFAILASNSHGKCFVVVHRTGEVLLETSLTDVPFNHNALHSPSIGFYGPINDQWLNDLKCFDFWPIATVFDNSKKENEIKVLVGTQNHSIWLARNGDD